jgi:hypothetical protein
MPKNALAPTPVNALDMAPYEGLYQFKNVGDPDRGFKGALNVYSALLPALMRARFPEYVAFSPATVTTAAPRGATSEGEFNTQKRTITLDPGGVNAMLMEPYGKYGYIGVGSDTTTEETLNALNTMLHEATHARTRLAPGEKRLGAHPADRLRAQMSGDRFDEMMRDIRISGLPSVGSVDSPVEIINEYFATATPTRHMAEKNMMTRRMRGTLSEVDRLAKKYPELEKMRLDWERPEIFVTK